MPLDRPLRLSDVACVSDSQVSSRVGDEVAILHLDESAYYGLDPVGARIWELLQEPVPLQSALDALLREFAVDADTAQRDMLALVSELIDKGLVELRGEDVG